MVLASPDGKQLVAEVCPSLYYLTNTRRVLLEFILFYYNCYHYCYYYLYCLFTGVSNFHCRLEFTLLSLSLSLSLSQSIFLLGVMFIMLDLRISGLVRERMLISYLRYFICLFMFLSLLSEVLYLSIYLSVHLYFI